MAIYGRNDKCSCGSGKKYKKCCMLKDDCEIINEKNINNDVSVCIDKGIYFFKMNQFNEAIEHFNKAIDIKPNCAEAYNFIGNIFFKIKQYDDALSYYHQAIRIKPDFVEAYNNYCYALISLGKSDEAEDFYRQAIKIKPNYAELHNNLGNVLKDLYRFDEARNSYCQAISLKPDLAEAHNNLAYVLKELGEFEKSLESYKQAISLNKNFSEAYYNLGKTLFNLGRLSESISNYRKAIDLKNDFYIAHSNLLFALNYCSNESPLNLVKESKLYGSLVSRKRSVRYTEWLCLQSAAKIRIGFVSGDFRDHPVGLFLEGLVSNIDQSKFELFAYKTYGDEDELTARLKPFFTEWREVFSSMTDKAAAKLIHADALHILIDLSGHTGKNRLPVFSYKPAPVQVSWLGYFATTGVDEIDYWLGDPYVTPKNEEHHFVERIWRLPETYLCFTPPTGKAEVNHLPALTNGYVTFGCFNNLTKMNDSVVVLWSNVLKAVPDSRLFLKTKQLADKLVVEQVLCRFATHGISRDRLILQGSSPRPELLASYNRVDIALDPFPYPGGTTTAEALWMGVPVLTRCGDRFLSHVGESIAHNTKQSEWIANGDEDYVRKAVKFSSDLDSLAKLRKGLREQVLASPLFDSPRFARHFEEVLLGMWNEWVSQREGIQ